MTGGSGGLWMQRRGSTRPFFSNGVPTELEPFYLQNLQQQSPAQQPGGGDEANFLRQTDDGMLQAPGRFSYHHDSAAADCVRSHAAVQRRMVGRDPTREEEADRLQAPAPPALRRWSPGGQLHATSAPGTPLAALHGLCWNLHNCVRRSDSVFH